MGGVYSYGVHWCGLKVRQGGWGARVGRMGWGGGGAVWLMSPCCLPWPWWLKGYTHCGLTPIMMRVQRQYAVTQGFCLLGWLVGLFGHFRLCHSFMTSGRQRPDGGCTRKPVPTMTRSVPLSARWWNAGRVALRDGVCEGRALVH